MGWEHTFIHQYYHLVDAIQNNRSIDPLGATFEDGYKCAVVCDAITKSAESGRRIEIVYEALGS